MAPLSKIAVSGLLAGLALAAPTTVNEKRSKALRKRGLAFQDSSVISLFDAPNTATWGYNWGSSASELPAGFEFTPLLWGPASEFTSVWEANAQSALDGGAKALMFYNEPDIPSQSNVSPGQAAADFMTYMQQFSGKAKLGAPAVSNSNLGGQGLEWLQSFLDACTSCDLDFVNIHWYNDVGQNQNFKDQVTQAHTMSGKPVWITEFGLNGGSDADIEAFFADVIPWMAEQSFVHRYSYFMAGDGYLVDGAALSPTGVTYNTLAI